MYVEGVPFPGGHCPLISFHLRGQALVEQGKLTPFLLFTISWAGMMQLDSYDALQSPSADSLSSHSPGGKGNSVVLGPRVQASTSIGSPCLAGRIYTFTYRPLPREGMQLQAQYRSEGVSQKRLGEV